MLKTGIANSPLHGGSCPRWLFPRMKKLAGAIGETLIFEYGNEEFLRRLADPYWLQSFGCVIGFDWHSSGLTTTTLGAIKEGVNGKNLGITVCGGKGKTSRKTPNEIGDTTYSISDSKIQGLQYASKMSAKVDNALVQDGYSLYHHSFIFNESGKWAVIQQGMNSENKYARRYHWLSSNVSRFIEEPHSAICCDTKNQALDLTSSENNEIKKISVDLVNDDINHFKKYFNIRLRTKSIQKTIGEFDGNATKILTMTPKHTIIEMDKRNLQMLQKAKELKPQNYEELAAIKGIGPKTLRSLALISELVYGTELNWKDPAKFSFAIGGKDKIPYEIDKSHYDETINIMKNAIKDAKLGEKERLGAIKRLSSFYAIS